MAAARSALFAPPVPAGAFAVSPSGTRHTAPAFAVPPAAGLAAVPTPARAPKAPPAAAAPAAAGVDASDHRDHLIRYTSCRVGGAVTFQVTPLRNPTQ
jgi:hypothetical protein